MNTEVINSSSNKYHDAILRAYPPITTTFQALPGMSYKIGVILGSTRRASNTLGFSNYFASLISTHFPNLTLETVHLANSPGHPLPLLLEDIPPAGHRKDTLPDAYEDESVRKWSATVLGWDGAIIITPQYNWSLPAPLKNAFDHLFNEWVDLPAGLITLGGHGGSKVHEQLKTICGGGLDMKMVGKGVEVNIPAELIRGKGRIRGDEAWLKEYDGRVKDVVNELVALVEKRRGEKEGDVVAAQVTA